MPREVPGGVDEEGAEQEEDLDEGRDGGRADGDERAAQDERQHDAEQQHLVLVHLRHGEAGHDDHEDEQVVDAEGVLGQVAGEELPAGLAARDHAQPDAEGDRQPDVEDDPAGRLADGDDVRTLAGRDRDVDPEDQHEGADGQCPDVQRDVEHGDLPRQSMAAPRGAVPTACDDWVMLPRRRPHHATWRR